MHTAQPDQEISSGSISGVVAQDGIQKFVPGALYRETGFDAADNYFDIQPVDFDGSHVNIKITDKNGNGTFDTISTEIPEIANLNLRVSHLEQGGTGTGSGGGDEPTFTPPVFKMYASPWNNGSGLQEAWDNLRLGYLAGIPNATIRVDAPANDAIQRRHVANFGYRANGWRNAFGGRTRDFQDTLTVGTQRINPGRNLFTALELSYLGEDPNVSDIYITNRTIQNNTFQASGFANNNQRRDVTYLQNGTYRTDLLLNFGSLSSINHEITLGLTLSLIHI